MHVSPWVAVFALAARQHGVVSRRQATSCGVDDATFTRRVRAERWSRPHRGVYLVPGARWTSETCIAAALVAVGDHAAASGMSALALHGVVDEAAARPILIVPHGRRAAATRSIRVIRSRTLADSDIATVDGLRCVTPARAFLDAAPSVTRGGLRPMLIAARQRGVVEPATVIERARTVAPGVPGRSRLLRAAHDVSLVGADSPLSDAVHRRLLADGFAPDPAPVAVAVGVGGRLLHPDITFTTARVCIECDSLAYHRDQRAIDLDHRKDQGYAAAWWRCLRIGWRRFDLDWPGFTAALASALAEWPTTWAGRLR